MTRANRQRLRQTVTPAAVKLTRTQDVPMKSWEGPVIPEVSFNNEVVVVAVLAAFFGALIGAGWEKGWGWMLVAGLFGEIVLLVVYLVYLWRTHMPKVERVEWQDQPGVVEPEPYVLDAGRVVIPHPNGTTVEFQQPKPGEFANWVGLVIQDMRDGNVPFRDKMQLSQNTSGERGWPRDMYRYMLATLKAAGFVSTGQNNTPVLTNYGVDAILAWLKGKAPTVN